MEPKEIKTFENIITAIKTKEGLSLEMIKEIGKLNICKKPPQYIVKECLTRVSVDKVIHYVKQGGGGYYN